MLAAVHPERVDEIEAFEGIVQAERDARNEERPGRYSHPRAKFFQVRHGLAPQGIRDVVQWAQSSRGGKQLPLFAPAPSGGCMRWGMCDPPEGEP